MGELEINLSEGVERAGPADWKLIADVTAEAFVDDPVNKWIFDDPKAIRACFRVFARETYARHGMCHIARAESGEALGATMWSRSGTTPALSGFAQLALGLGIGRHGGKRALERAHRAGALMEMNIPKEPHFYLFTIGVRPEAKGTGRGRALLAPVLEACDRAGMACYLENSNPANFGFYSGHGFEHMHHFDAGPGGPPLQAMWRKPKR